VVEPDTACEAEEKTHRGTEAPRKTLKKISEPLCLGVALAAAMTARLQLRQAGSTDQQASRAERQAFQQVQAATERVRQLRAEVVPLKSCVLPDETAHPVDATVTFQGQTMRCVIVLGRDLKPADVAWSLSSTQ
jgi:hypothetical protein